MAKALLLHPQNAGGGGLHLFDLLEGLFHSGALPGEVDLDLGLGAGGTDNELAAAFLIKVIKLFLQKRV